MILSAFGNLAREFVPCVNFVFSSCNCSGFAGSIYMLLPL
jgi:hypothetical protein